MRRDVFISRATEDAWLAQRILFELEDEGLLCWDASRDIPEGRPWPDEIPRSIEECSVLLVLVSESGNASEDVPIEVSLARERGLVILPVLVNGCRPGDKLAYLLNLSQSHDLHVPAEEADLDVSHLGALIYNVLSENLREPVLLPGDLDVHEVATVDPTGFDFRKTPEEGVHTLIATADTYRVPPIFQAVGLLTEQLPDLEDIFLVVGIPGHDDGARLRDAIRAKATDLAKIVTVHPVHRIAAKQVDRREQSALRKLLRSIERGPVTRVDITGGTVPMSLAVKRAAEATGHRVTYTLSSPALVEGSQLPDREKQAIYEGWIDVTDSFVFNRYLGRPAGPAGGTEPVQ